MVSRPLVISLLVAAGRVAAEASSSPNRGLRALQADSGSSSSQDIPDVLDARRHLTEEEWSQEWSSRALRPAFGRQCWNNVVAAAGENEKIKKDDYFYFTDGMSNGYYTQELGATEYSDLPTNNKFGFVTLSCQCTQMGGAGNCCQGPRAKLDLTGIGEGPAAVLENQSLHDYIVDICQVTTDAIGDNKLPPTGELPGWKPTASPTVTSAPTSSAAPSEVPTSTGWPSMTPTVADLPAVENPDGGGTPTPDPAEESLSAFAWVAIAMGAMWVVTAMGYAMSDKEKPLEVDDDDLDEMSVQNNGKELLAITNGEIDEDAPPRQDSPDATNSMTMSDVSSIPSMSTGKAANNGNSNYYAENSLLPGRPDEESMLSSSDGPSFFTDESEAGVEVQSALNNTWSSGHSGSSGSALDQAIESGNWEAVAASAAALVQNNDPVKSTLDAGEVGFRVKKWEAATFDEADTGVEKSTLDPGEVEFRVKQWEAATSHDEVETGIEV